MTRMTIREAVDKTCPLSMTNEPKQCKAKNCIAFTLVYKELTDSSRRSDLYVCSMAHSPEVYQ